MWYFIQQDFTIVLMESFVLRFVQLIFESGQMLKLTIPPEPEKKIFGRLRLIHPAPAIEPGGRIEVCDQ